MSTIIEKLNRIVNTKSSIKSALIAKGRTPSDAFSTYAEEILAISDSEVDLSSVTAEEKDVRQGKVFVDSTGAEKTGTQTSRSRSDVIIEDGVLSVLPGIYDEQVQMSVPTGNGEQATPVIDIDDNGLVTATAGTKSATKQLDTKPGVTVTPGTEDQTVVPAKHFAIGDIVVKGDSNLIPSNIPKDVTIFGVQGEREIKGGTDVSNVTAAASDVRQGKVFVDSTGAEKEGTQPTRSSADVTLTGGSAAGKIVVEWDGNLEGKDLLGRPEDLGMVACKLSGRVFSDDEIKTGNITIAVEGGAETHIYAVSPMWDTITSDAEMYNDDYVMVVTNIGNWVFTKNSGLILYGLPFDEPGVYVLLAIADLITRFETRSGDNTGTSETAIVTVPAGIYDQQVQVDVPAGEQATPEIAVSEGGLITAIAGDKTAYKQLSTQGGKTITPGPTEQIAVAAGKYVTGDVKVAAVQNTGGSDGISIDIHASGEIYVLDVGYVNSGLLAVAEMFSVSAGPYTET